MSLLCFRIFSWWLIADWGHIKLCGDFQNAPLAALEHE